MSRAEVAAKLRRKNISVMAQFPYGLLTSTTRTFQGHWIEPETLISFITCDQIAWHITAFRRILLTELARLKPSGCWICGRKTVIQSRGSVRVRRTYWNCVPREINAIRKSELGGDRARREFDARPMYMYLLPISSTFQRHTKQSRPQIRAASSSTWIVAAARVGDVLMRLVVPVLGLTARWAISYRLRHPKRKLVSDAAIAGHGRSLYAKFGRWPRSIRKISFHVVRGHAFLDTI